MKKILTFSSPCAPPHAAEQVLFPHKVASLPGMLEFYKAQDTPHNKDLSGLNVSLETLI